VIAVLSLVLVVGIPVAAVLFARRAHRPAPVSYSLQIAPPAPRPPVDVRTPEQRAADQARFDAALPRDAS
jgi:hypothetical protein